MLRAQYRGDVQARSVILATGGLSIPKLGASDLSLRIAKAFGLKIVPTAPALVPLVLADADPSLAGVSLNVVAMTGKKGPRFEDGMVFTHRGVSGPAILQISSYLENGGSAQIDLLPAADLLAEHLLRSCRCVTEFFPRCRGCFLPASQDAALRQWRVAVSGGQENILPAGK